MANNLVDYNEDVEAVLVQVVKQIGTCSDNIHTLFSVLILSVGAGVFVIYSRDWLRDLVLDVAKALIANRGSSLWAPCINSVAAYYRSELEMAALGV